MKAICSTLRRLNYYLPVLVSLQVLKKKIYKKEYITNQNCFSSWMITKHFEDHHSFTIFILTKAFVFRTKSMNNHRLPDMEKRDQFWVLHNFECFYWDLKSRNFTNFFVSLILNVHFLMGCLHSLLYLGFYIVPLKRYDSKY